MRLKWIYLIWRQIYSEFAFRDKQWLPVQLSILLRWIFQNLVSRCGSLYSGVHLFFSVDIFLVTVDGFFEVLFKGFVLVDWFVVFADEVFTPSMARFVALFDAPPVPLGRLDFTPEGKGVGLVFLMGGCATLAEGYAILDSGFNWLEDFNVLLGAGISRDRAPTALVELTFALSEITLLLSLVTLPFEKGRWSVLSPDDDFVSW